MARVLCIDCGKSVASFVYTEYDEDRNGVKPVCDKCAGPRGFSFAVKIRDGLAGLRPALVRR